jgi:HPt (histidine-containing phosphotransfer) domain-containing protein
LRSFDGEAVKLVAQIEAARAAHDAPAALPPLHTLKGLAGTIGAERLQELARRAEAALKQPDAAGAWQQVADAANAVPPLRDDVAALVAQLAAGH